MKPFSAQKVKNKVQQIYLVSIELELEPKLEQKLPTM